MEGRYWISWLLFLAGCSFWAWWFSNGNILTGLLVFAFLTIPLSLWVRAKARKKLHPIKGTKK
jgi:hypothetical protein